MVAYFFLLKIPAEAHSDPPLKIKSVGGGMWWKYCIHVYENEKWNYSRNGRRGD
jgi:hypothetical protein